MEGKYEEHSTGFFVMTKTFILHIYRYTAPGLVFQCNFVVQQGCIQDFFMGGGHTLVRPLGSL